MTFEHAHITTWKDGQYFNAENANVIVSYDGSNDAYQIDEKDRADFEAWVYTVFGGDETEDDEINIKWG